MIAKSRKIKVVVAAFDLDGTLTTDDSLIFFLRYTHGKMGVIRHLLHFLPTWLLFKLRILSNHIAKEKLLDLFYGGYDVRTFERLGEEFSLQIMDDIIDEAMLERVRWHKSQGHEVVLVTAAVLNWVEGWALKNGFNHVLATRLEVTGSVLSGHLDGKNCYGQQKVERLLEVYPNRNGYYFFAYGNSRGDRQMLDWADEGYWVSHKPTGPILRRV